MWFQSAFMSALLVSNYSPCVLSLLDCWVPPHTLWPSQLVSLPCAFIPQSGHSFPIRALIFILCRLSVSLSIEILYTTPLCFPITSLPSPFLFIRFSDFWFWLLISLTTLLPVFLDYVSLITWLPNSAWINNDFCICPGLHLAPYSEQHSQQNFDIMCIRLDQWFVIPCLQLHSCPLDSASLYGALGEPPHRRPPPPPHNFFFYPPTPLLTLVPYC